MTITQLPFQGQDFPFKIGYKCCRTGLFLLTLKAIRRAL